jgi:Protein of unknown function (DUF1698)
MYFLRYLLKSTGSSKRNANPFYVTGIPTNQNIVDIFAGDWSMAMPEEGVCISTPGQAKLFDDPRVHWAERELGGFKGANVLELGPLEGHHSYMLHKAGAKSVLAIEANSRAFLKCLCIKEIFKLDNVSFLLGDCVEYLKGNKQTYDLVFANGILYHMQNPIELLELLGKTTDRIVMWTHYYDANQINRNSRLVKKFGPLKELQYGNFSYEGVQQHYNEGRLLLTLLSKNIFPLLLRKTGLGWRGFCGGPLPTSIWLTRESIIRYLKFMGFNEVKISFESMDHPNGPSFNLCATRVPSRLPDKDAA